MSETLFPKIIFLQRNQRAVGQQRIIRQQPVIQTHTALPYKEAPTRLPYLYARHEHHLTGASP